jgi:hypothetical protein
VIESGVVPGVTAGAAGAAAGVTVFCFGALISASFRPV